MPRFSVPDLVPDIFTSYRDPATSVTSSTSKYDSDDDEFRPSDVTTTDLTYSSDEDDNDDPNESITSSNNSAMDDDTGCNHVSQSQQQQQQLPFSLGRTRFALNENEAIDQYKRRVGFYRPKTSKTTPELIAPPSDKPYPTFHYPTTSDDNIISQYHLNSQTAPTDVLIKYAQTKLPPQLNLQQQQQQQQQQLQVYNDTATAMTNFIPQEMIGEDYSNRCVTEIDEDIDMLSQLIEASHIVDDTVQGLLTLHNNIENNNKIAVKNEKQSDQMVANTMKQIHHQYEKEHKETVDEFTAFLKRIEENAEKIRREQQERLQEQEEIIRQQQHQLQLEQQQQDEERAKQKERDRPTADETNQQQQQQQQQRESAPPATEQLQATPPRQQRQSPKRGDTTAASTASSPSTPTSNDPEYVVKAKKLIEQLKKLQKSVEVFESSKVVARRRLLFKKTVNGKVNTLAENVQKIQEVANEVAKVISDARNEDDTNKKQLEGNPNAVPTETTLGKRYMIDLLCSKVIVRVQAEGFNGQRGDGFPLAAMLASIARTNRDMVPVLAAHIYTVCPTAIPTLPHTAPDASEDEFMKSLGMLQIQKDGEPVQFESFERFLARTEGVISLVANIMSSQPSDHELLGGHRGAVKWLQRFLALLPDPPQLPLPLLTAAVLDAFLRGAGHMLANHHGSEFRPILDTITNDIINRLDVSAIGLPSSIRLKKAIEGGFDGFKQTLPSRAMAELYYGAAFASGDNGGTSTARNPATSSASVSTAGGPFGATQSKSPFGASSNTQQSGSNNSQPSNPFGASSSGSTFGSLNNSSISAPSPFSKEGTQSTSTNPFGGGGGGNAPPFGGSNTTPSFGGSSAFSNSPAPSGDDGGMEIGGGDIGMNSSSPSPFGGSNTSSMFGANVAPFVAGTTMPNPSPFGGGPQNTATPFGMQSSTPFGGASSISNPTPFSGGGMVSSNPLPFGTNQAQSSALFGQASNQSTFGGGSMMAPAPSPFTGSTTTAPNTATFGAYGGSAQTPFSTGGSLPFGTGTANPPAFGSPAANQSPFSMTTVTTQQNSSIFGNTSSNPSPFGGGTTSTPFGGSAFGGGGNANASPFGLPASNTISSPFGNSAPAPTPFGGSSFGTPSTFGSSQTTPFGGGGGGGSQQKSNRPPCKFFQQGRCTKGANCNFSHDTPQINNFSNAFGGPRR